MSEYSNYWVDRQVAVRAGTSKKTKRGRLSVASYEILSDKAPNAESQMSYLRKTLVLFIACASGVRQYQKNYTESCSRSPRGK